MIFNTGTGIPTSMKELAKKMIEISGLDLDPIYDREKVDSKVILHQLCKYDKSKGNFAFCSQKSD